MTAMLEAVDVLDQQAGTADQAGPAVRQPELVETGLAGFQGCGDRLGHRM
jgi:hypothetical protein